MKYIHVWLIFCSMLVCTFHSTSGDKFILSIEAKKKSKDAVSIASHDGMSIVPEGKKSKNFTMPLSIQIRGRKIKINGSRVTTGIWHIIPHNGTMIVNDQTYDGPAILQVDSHLLTLTPHKNLITTSSLAQKKDIRPSHIIRALIHELAAQHPVTITSAAGFIMYDPQLAHAKKEYTKDTLTITCKDKTLSINGQQCEQSQLRIIPKDGYAGINGTQFHGSFSIVHYDNRFLIINHVDLEEYIYAVLQAESWPGWPIEVNKAFAIASRSYALKLMKQADKTNQPYHIKNTSEHQNYKGMHTNTELRTAVEETRGIFLMYQNEPILAMFDICCGGIIPAHVDQFDFTKVPYLARTYPCKHCKRTARYSWKKEWSLTDLSNHIEKILQKPIKVHDIKIAKKDKAGLVHELHVNHKKEVHPITSKKLYSALKKDLKSFCYTVQRKKDTVIFSGRGMGHHLGICQWGAREMVRDGWPYNRILSFYYPGTSLMKLT